MRFRTIWSLPGLPLKERIDRTKDWGALEIGSKLPWRIKYWTVISVAGKATATVANKHPMAVTIEDMMEAVKPSA
jgi:hypothetical protein